MLFRILGNTKADFWEKLETDAEFIEREFRYITEELNISFMYSPKYINDQRFQFDVKHITTDILGQSFYGFSHMFGHDVYLPIEDYLLINLEII